MKELFYLRSHSSYIMVMFMSVGMIVLIMILFNSSSGGIGIHAGLRNQCRKACGFESHLEDNKVIP